MPAYTGTPFPVRSQALGVQHAKRHASGGYCERFVASLAEIVGDHAGHLELVVDHKDIPTVQGLIVLVTAIYIVANLVVDLVKAGLDPRVRVYLAGQTI